LPELAPEPGGLLSVALSVAFPRLDVIQHPALWCPDFPPALLPAAIRYPQANLKTIAPAGKCEVVCMEYGFARFCASLRFFRPAFFAFFLY
jgi:hypothetical protein